MKYNSKRMAGRSYFNIIMMVHEAILNPEKEYILQSSKQNADLCRELIKKKELELKININNIKFKELLF